MPEQSKSIQTYTHITARDSCFKIDFITVFLLWGKCHLTEVSRKIDTPNT